jgi:short-subunit dehydrogenase
MKLQSQRILLTGAAGGIGGELAKLLAHKGASIVLLDHDASGLSRLLQEIKSKGATDVHLLAHDLSDPAKIAAAIKQASHMLGGLDMLINNAGLLDFAAYTTQSAERIALTLQVNTLAPMLLTHAVLPQFKAQGKGTVVNIGSTFGTIGFPHYATYSASKFALRGFSEALRRELLTTNIGVIYIAPRATSTKINTSASVDMMQAQGTKIDSAELVAGKIVQAIELQKTETYIGQPEGFFARLNALLPRLVDLALKKQTINAKSYL